MCLTLASEVQISRIERNLEITSTLWLGDFGPHGYIINHFVCLTMIVP